jgi:hypothetical protein
METVEILDFASLFAAVLARLRNWVSGTRGRAAWRNRDIASRIAKDAAPAHEAAWRACIGSAPPGA